MTLRSVFPVVLRDMVSDSNSLVLASTSALSGSRMLAAGGKLPAGLMNLDAAVAGKLTPALAGGEVFTDDRAPFEWLTDFSIVRYATGHR